MIHRLMYFVLCGGICFPSALMFPALLAFEVSLVLLQRNMALFFIIFLDYSMTNKQDSFTRAFSCSIIFMSDIMLDFMNVTTMVCFLLDIRGLFIQYTKVRSNCPASQKIHFFFSLIHLLCTNDWDIIHTKIQ